MADTFTQEKCAEHAVLSVHVQSIAADVGEMKKQLAWVIRGIVLLLGIGLGTGALKTADVIRAVTPISTVQAAPDAMPLGGAPQDASPFAMPGAAPVPIPYAVP